MAKRRHLIPSDIQKTTRQTERDAERPIPTLLRSDIEGQGRYESHDHLPVAAGHVAYGGAHAGANKRDLAPPSGWQFTITRGKSTTHISGPLGSEELELRRMAERIKRLLIEDA